MWSTIPHRVQHLASISSTIRCKEGELPFAQSPGSLAVDSGNRCVTGQIKSTVPATGHDDQADAQSQTPLQFTTIQSESQMTARKTTAVNNGEMVGLPNN